MRIFILSGRFRRTASFLGTDSGIPLFVDHGPDSESDDIRHRLPEFCQLRDCSVDYDFGTLHELRKSIDARADDSSLVPA